MATRKPSLIKNKKISCQKREEAKTQTYIEYLGSCKFDQKSNMAARVQRIVKENQESFVTNIMSSETTCPMKLKLHILVPVNDDTQICSRCLCHFSAISAEIWL